MAWLHKLSIAALLASCLATGVAFAQQGAGEWRLDESDGAIRAGYFIRNTAPDAEPLLILSCDRLNASLTGFYRNDTPALIDAARAGSLTLQFVAPQAKAAIPAYAAQAPGEDAIGFEAPFTPELAAALGARDLTLTIESSRIGVDAAGASALAKLAASCPLAAAVPGAMQYRTYVDANGGFSVDIPARLFRLANADRNGRGYVAQVGNAELMLSVYANALEQDIAKAYAAALADKSIVAAPTYKTRGKDFFVISGKTQGRIVYVKSLLTCNGSVWTSLRLDYDEAAKADYDAVLTRMAQSFTPRTDADGKPLCE